MAKQGKNFEISRRKRAAKTSSSAVLSKAKWHLNRIKNEVVGEDGELKYREKYYGVKGVIARLLKSMLALPSTKGSKKDKQELGMVWLQIKDEVDKNLENARLVKFKKSLPKYIYPVQGYKVEHKGNVDVGNFALDFDKSKV